MIKILFIFSATVLLIGATGHAQPSSLSEGESSAIGAWEEVPPPNDQSGFTITIETGKKSLYLRPNHTAMMVIPPVFDNKERRIECTWIIRRDDDTNEYYLEVTQGQGFQIIWKYRFDRWDYIVDSFGVKYAKK